MAFTRPNVNLWAIAKNETNSKASVWLQRQNQLKLRKEYGTACK